MKYPGRFLCLLPLLICLSPTARADSTVVINEIMYHPATNETALEWIELRNQMAVPMEISNWRLSDGIDYTFPEGTIIAGGGYLVVALNPAGLMAATGLTNVLGPFTGRLSNGGEEIDLRNNNNRLMDSVNYGVEGDWPVAPDGAGPSLSKLDEELSGDRDANWRMSEVIGGTPGLRNFPPRVTTIGSTNAVVVDSPWRFNTNGVDLGDGWRGLGYADETWGTGAGVFFAGTPPPTQIQSIPTLFSSGIGTNGLALAVGAADPHYFLTLSANSTPPPPAIAATVMANNTAWLGNDPASTWIGAISSGAANVQQGAYHFRTTFDLTGFNPATAQITLQAAVDNELTNVLLNGVSIGMRYTNFAAFSPGFTVTNGFLAGMNTLDFQTFNISAAPNPGGFRVKASGMAAKYVPTNTSLALGPSTYYFRKTFVLSGNAALTGLQLRPLADDGAVYYLNGVEVLRQNMPGGLIGFSTPAVTNVGTADFAGPFNISNASLVSGTNVLAVEVHQAAGGGNDALFGAELAVLTTNLPPALPPTIAFNEVSSVTNGQFTIELFNHGPGSIALNGYSLARFGNPSNASYTIPSQVLPSGGFLVLNKAMMGFGADPGDQVILYGPGQASVLDALVAKSYPRARSPDGTGDWLAPDAPTFGSSNSFTFHDEIVINEIMYSHRELPPVAEVRFTNSLLTMTNVWRYNQQGQELGSAWRAMDYDDSAWPSGNSLFWTGLTGTNLVELRGTSLNLSNGSQQLITYYFRAPFVITNNPLTTLLSLRHYVDDGAVFYLNGEEIYRYGITANPVYATNLATFNIGVPTNAGPVILPTTNFFIGTNILAVEVHQVFPPPVSRDVVFGAELVATGVAVAAQPARESPEAWVELFNRSSNAVNLTGWRLDNAIQYDFPTGTVIAAGGYLVVAKDAAYLQGLHPSITILGNYSGNLSKGGEMIVLKDAADNPADRVRYHDDKPWPSFADGKGSSLELRDPRADNSRPETWADSDEGRHSQWRSYTYSGIAATEAAASPTTWREFVFGLLGDGEVLLDDISVIEAPLGSNRQLIQNGTFETGLGAWRFLGNHRRATVITDPANAGNKVLRLVTDGDTEHMHNHAETTLAFGAAITNGVEYRISFRAKWIAGCEKLNTRLYFNKLAKTTDLEVPIVNGTPGAINSRYATNIGPTFDSFQHFPVVPTAAQTVTISATASDLDGIASATVNYSVNGGAWQSAMIPVNGLPSSASLQGIIPAFTSPSVVQFYLEATDIFGVKSTYPAGGTNSRALYAVGGQALRPQLKTMRLIMTPADVAYMHASTNVMSNERYGCTVIADESRVFYNAGVHLQGSERGRDNSTRVGFSVRLPAGELYRGVHESFTIDRSGGYSGKGGDHDEILIKHAINKVGGLPGMYDDLVQVFAPRSSEDGTGLLILAKYGPVFLDSQYDNGGDGELFKLELIYSPTTTSTGDPQAPKLPQPDGVLGTDIKNLGDTADAYRWTFLKENHVARDNYGAMINLAKAFDLTGPVLDAQMRQLMDVDEWMRAVAFIGLVGGGDIYTYGNSHNHIIYFRPEDNKAMSFLWDLDFSFIEGNLNQAIPGSGSANTHKLITTIPANYRSYYCHLMELSAITGDSTYMNAWASRYAGLLGENWSAAVDFLARRAAVVRGQLPLGTAFAITSNGGNNFGTTNTVVTLAGTAPLTVKEILVNSVSYPINWTSTTAWSVLVPLTSPTNFLTFQGVDGVGGFLSNAVDSIVITNTGIAAPLPVVINEWMAGNGAPGGFIDPLDDGYQDWFELFNPNFVPVNLSGYYLTDNLGQPNKWQIPSGTQIPARGFLLVWADDQTGQNGQGGDLHANFQLSAGGEALGLYSTNLTPQHRIVFGSQTQNVSQGLFPDGNTNTFYFMTNWTPRASNQLGAPPSPQMNSVMLLPGGEMSFQFSAIVNRSYRVDYKNDLNHPAWTPLSTNRATSATITIIDSTVVQTQRFYRTLLLQ